MEINWSERRARFEVALQYRTYLGLHTLAYSELQAGRMDNYRHFKNDAITHRDFARICAYIVTGKFSNIW